MRSVPDESEASLLSISVSMRSSEALRWDLFCRVVDNFGDIGFCWRLACDLAGRGQVVRLWVDDPRALTWMAPSGHAGVTWRDWADADDMRDVSDVVIEAFGCELPVAWVARMAAKPRAPVWINLEYLSAESYVERCHGLPSPQPCGLTKWFYFPGFTAGTGGLLREHALTSERENFESTPWLAARGLALSRSERLVSLFCYPEAPLQGLLHALASQGPALILAAPGAATQLCANAQWPVGLRWQALPWLSQTEYDRCLWSCDLNLVRGEDSLVRALWAARPFLWQAYRQHDGVHHQKVAAFMDHHLNQAHPALAAELRSSVRHWNEDTVAQAASALTLPALGAWNERVGSGWLELTQRHANRLARQKSLGEGLLQFAAQKR